MPIQKSHRRTRNLFNPKSEKPYRLSRSRLENFINCPRCFYLDRRLGIEPPGIPAFTLNSAVDHLLKKEFDIYRAQQRPHPIMERFGFQGVPFDHPMLDQWREVFKGIQYHHPSTNFTIFGAVDDLWLGDDHRIYVVDYKATSTNDQITLNSPYREAYKRQMEIYQWLLRKQDLNVADTGYFLYCNGNKAKETFSERLEFTVELIPYQGEDGWVESKITAAHQCLTQDSLPELSESCLYCHYRKMAAGIEDDKFFGFEKQAELF